MTTGDNREISQQISHPQTEALTKVGEATAVVAGAGAAALALWDPITGIIAAGLAPLVVSRLSQLYSSRVTRLAAAVKRREIDFDTLLSGDAVDLEDKIDLLKQALGGALDTNSNEKVEFLVHMLQFGLKSNMKIEVLFAKRVARTVSRIDELEMILLASLSRTDRGQSGVRIADLATQSGVADVNIIRSGLSVLASEGLVIEQGPQGEQFRMSDYGENVLRELKSAISQERQI